MVFKEAQNSFNLGDFSIVSAVSPRWKNIFAPKIRHTSCRKSHFSPSSPIQGPNDLNEGEMHVLQRNVENKNILLKSIHLYADIKRLQTYETVVINFRSLKWCINTLCLIACMARFIHLTDKIFLPIRCIDIHGWNKDLWPNSVEQSESLNSKPRFQVWVQNVSSHSESLSQRALHIILTDAKTWPTIRTLHKFTHRMQ